MISSPRVLRIGTRGSTLARRQAAQVAELLSQAHPSCGIEVVEFVTHGDRDVTTPLPQLGGKGAFTAELEEALRSGAIDVAVHSLKDLPVAHADGLALGATPRRENPADALVSRRGYTLDTLPLGAAVGASSRRRSAQLMHLRPDLRVLDVRGNIDTRLRKAFADDSPYAAIVLAYAGLARLGRTADITQVIPFDIMVPAPAQGALGVQCCNTAQILSLLGVLEDRETRLCVTAERAFLAGVGGGCALPVAALATIAGSRLRLRGRVTSCDGRQQIDVELSGPASGAEPMGRSMAQHALAQGAAALMAELATPCPPLVDPLA